jgi:NADPH-dependent 2,4-dienoyl-CoA reductase/sulfur reductase-like enzyme
MDRREFSKKMIVAGMAATAGTALGGSAAASVTSENHYEEPAKQLPVRRFDVLVAGGGTAGVVAALAAARQGAKTALVEVKGYPGGTAAALCAAKNRGTRDLRYSELRDSLTKAGVYFED